MQHDRRYIMPDIDAHIQDKPDHDKRGERFLELIDEQNRVMWKITTKLATLISLNWDSTTHKEELETLVKRHTEILKAIDDADMAPL